MSALIETTLAIDASNCGRKPSQLLAEHTGLSQAIIKDAMKKGAVWHLRGANKRRLRRASKSLVVGDVLALNYNAELLAADVPAPSLIHDAGEYSVWFKPYGLYCQGSRWGDFASIDRWVALNCPCSHNNSMRPVFLVHRLDRATSGLMLLCHSKSAARLFSAKFRAGEIRKCYQAIVWGDFSIYPQAYEADSVLDDKRCRSLFSCVATDDHMSLLNVELLTGRKHQIRRQLSTLGFPIVGDRLYGDSDNHARNLQLQSVSLAFDCPLHHAPKAYVVDDALRLQLVGAEQ